MGIQELAVQTAGGNEAVSIATYTQLQTAIGSWLLRSDLSATIPTFIAMAEARMNRDKRLRVSDAIVRDSLTVTGQFTALPSDFKQMINVERDADPVIPLEYKSPQGMDAVRNVEGTGAPRFYCIHGTELELAPVEACELEIIYYRNIPSLSDSATTNWLLTAAPDIYLYACLVESAPFLKDDERIAVWESLYQQRVEEYRQTSEADQVSGSPIVMNAVNIG